MYQSGSNAMGYKNRFSVIFHSSCQRDTEKNTKNTISMPLIMFISDETFRKRNFVKSRPPRPKLIRNHDADRKTLHSLINHRPMK